jgi:hypothetical protein
MGFEPALLVLDILKTEKSAFVIVLFPIQNIPDEGTLFIQKKVGSALTETETDFSAKRKYCAIFFVH